MIYRNISNNLLEALAFSPVVLLNGARQTGKSTLAQWIAKKQNMQYYTLDDFSVLDAVNRDAAGFLSGIKSPAVLDEVQRTPHLFQAIKMDVDNNRSPGKFLLTGSANIFLLPKLSESLAGRMEILTLWPFSCDELTKRKNMFIDNLFADDFPSLKYKKVSRDSIIDLLLKGGYPEAHKLDNERRKNVWFGSYITTILQRDIRDISKIEGIHELPKLLSILASQCASVLNITSLSRDTGIPLMTLKRYLILLEATFLVKRLPAWFTNIRKRMIKSPKIYLNDTGLLAYLLGINHKQLLSSHYQSGHVIENFVMQELFKQASWSSTQPRFYFYRTAAGKEVDFILENSSGQIVGIEVKASNTVQRSDFKGLTDVKESTGKRFLRGMVIYFGDTIIPYDKDLFAVPISALCFH